MDAITAGGLATLLLEGVKWILRKFWGAGFDFPEGFYMIAIPTLTFAVKPLLVLLSVGEYTFPAVWSAWLLELVRVLVGSLIALLVYNGGIKPLKAYRKSE